MKTLKATLSVILSVIMALSVCAAAFAAVPEDYTLLPKADSDELAPGAYWYDADAFIAAMVASGMPENETTFYKRASFYLSPDANTLIMVMQNESELEMARDNEQFAPYFSFLKQHEGGETPCAHANLTATPAKEGNCTQPGNSAYWTCEDCGLFFSDANAENEIAENSWVTGVDPERHDFDDTIEANVTIVPATCLENGSKTVKCSRCDATDVTVLAAPGSHDFGDWTRNIDPTCTTPGEDIRTCQREGCTAKETREVAALNHNFGEWTLTTAPTCTAKGEETRACRNEGCTEKETREVAALNHNFGEWTQTTAPTCTAKGEETRTCQNEGCTEKETREVAALNHAFGEWTQTTAPTCTGKGVETRVCSRCETPETRELAALGHQWGEWTVTKEATETEKGEKTRECAVCHEKETQSIPTVNTGKCKWCDETHDNGFVGKLTAFFHSILYFFAHLFGRK